jgi:hypothetical protein
MVAEKQLVSSDKRSLCEMFFKVISIVVIPCFLTLLADRLLRYRLVVVYNHSQK